LGREIPASLGVRGGHGPGTFEKGQAFWGKGPKNLLKDIDLRMKLVKGSLKVIKDG